MSAFSLFGLSALFFIFFLDASGQVREIRRRNWRTLNPYSSVAANATGTTVQDSADANVQ